MTRIKQALLRYSAHLFSDNEGSSFNAGAFISFNNLFYLIVQ